MEHYFLNTHKYLGEIFLECAIISLIIMMVSMPKSFLMSLKINYPHY